MSEAMNVKVKVEIGGVDGATVVPSPKALDAVLFDFNTTGSIDVVVVKALCAAVIQKMQDIQDRYAKVETTEGWARSRMAAVAITQMEICQMIAVKAYFAK
jgi:hypothetical protein